MIVTRLEPPLPLSMKVTKTGSSEKALCAEAVIHLGAMHRDSLRSGLQHHGDLWLVRVALTSPAVESKVEPTGTPTKSQGESEEDSMDSNPSLEMIEVDQPYCQLLRETNLLGGRQCAVIKQWMRGVKPKTLWEVNCIVYAATPEVS